jgi:hypothetical protein
VEGILTEHFLIGQKLSRQNWQSACYRASLIKTFTQYRTTKRIKEQNQQTQTSKSCSISHYFMHFSHVPPTQYCKYTMTTPTPVQRTLFTLWENESQENELRVLLLPGCPSIVTTLRWSWGKSGWAKGNPSCGFCGSMMSNSAHCRIINCPRVEAIGTFLKGTNQFVERLLPATTCLRKMAWGFEQIYSRVSRICEVYIRPSPLHC